MTKLNRTVTNLVLPYRSSKAVMVHVIPPDLQRIVSTVREAPLATLMRHPDLLLGQEGRVSVHWAPFEYVSAEAKVVLLGITPGLQQADIALRDFRQALLSGVSVDAALKRAKASASFAGSMRSNLEAMLDHVRLHEILKVPSCAGLFTPAASSLVHFTSALRYPVLLDGKNYNGSPNMIRTPLLRSMVDGCLAEEARALPDAIWVPLGPKPAEALHHLVERGVLRASHVLGGLPHPSGANGESIALWTDRKSPLDASRRRPPGPILAARETMRAQVAQLRGG